MSLLNRFRGCLIGGLIGDCMGAPFEGDFPISLTVLYNFLTKQLDETKKLQMFPFTDDTAMTKSVAESLIQMNGFDAKDMAKRFTNEFFRDRKRGYGANVIDVFAALKLTNFESPFQPAKHQFNGTGSYGNGGAMRTGPVPLFGYHYNDEELAKLGINCAKITHSNRNGYNGAILQCFAIREALKTTVSPNDNSFDINLFINSLIENFGRIESKDLEETNDNSNFTDDMKLTNMGNETPFLDKLNKIKEIISDESEMLGMSAERVAYVLGNDISALKSVPSAIYSVLRAQKPIEGFQTDNPFVRTLYFSIALGGDTDTIASMACSIAGALYGSDLIPNTLQNRCEDIQKMDQLSNDLYNLKFNI